MEQFTLTAGKWFALTVAVMDPPDRHHSPVYIHEIEPQGNEMLRVHLFHAHNPSGIQDQTLLLRIERRDARRLSALVEQSNPRCGVLLEPLTASWLITRFPDPFGNHSPSFPVEETMNHLYPGLDKKSKA